MNWSNIDLKDGYERDQNLIEPLKFSTLLLEVECNCKEINGAALIKQFEADLQSRIDEAREIFGDNLRNLTKHAQATRDEA
jgi:hypothetical protein